MAREYFKAFHSYLKSIEPLNDAERGRLFTAMLVYSITGEEPDLRGNERFIFPTMKANIDREIDGYRNTVETNRANGSKGGRPSKPKKSEKTNSVLEKPTESEKSQDKEKDKEKDKDSKKENIQRKTADGFSTHTPEDSSATGSDKPKKFKCGEYKHVLLTKEEIERLTENYGAYKTGEAIKHLDEYIEMKGYKAKSHYLAIQKWVLDALDERDRKRGYAGQRGKGGKPLASSFDVDDFFEAALRRVREEDAERVKTAANYEGIRESM